METSEPIVIDLGKKRRKQIKELLRGQGKLLAEVAEATEQVRSRLGTEAAGKEIVPVVLVYTKKRKRGSLRLPIPF